MKITALTKPTTLITLCFMAFCLLIIAAAADSISTSKVRELLQKMGGANLKKDQVHIKQITPGVGGGGVIVEAQIETSFRLAKDKDDWRIAEVRFGDRQWESFELIEEAIKREKARRTMTMLKELAAGLEAYRKAQGQYAPTDDIAVLLDYLSPRYLAMPYRFDLWGKQFEYKGSASGYRLVSTGPDGKSRTADDLVIEDGNVKSASE